MKFVDEMFEFYRDKLTGNEDDIDLLTYALLEELSYEDLLQLIQEMDQEELYQLIGMYLIHAFREKLAKENYGQKKISTFSQRNIH